VGVAFCLLICLRKYLRDLNFWQDRPEPNLKNFCDLVALGTVADVVPLVGENRMFSKTGLEIIKEGGRPGISALIKACGISNNAVDSGEKKMFEEIIDVLKLHPDMLRQSTLVLSSSGWHEGVLGIVASKVVEKYFHTVREMTTPDNFLQTIVVDYELDFDKISDDLIDELESLEPYGAGNPEPLFMSGNIKVVFSKIIGRNHRRMRLKQTSGRGRIINAIQERQRKLLLKKKVESGNDA